MSPFLSLSCTSARRCHRCRAPRRARRLCGVALDATPCRRALRRAGIRPAPPRGSLRARTQSAAPVEPGAGRVGVGRPRRERRRTAALPRHCRRRRQPHGRAVLARLFALRCHRPGHHAERVVRGLGTGAVRANGGVFFLLCGRRARPRLACPPAPRFVRDRAPQRAAPRPCRPADRGAAAAQSDRLRSDVWRAGLVPNTFV
jgi:hypothetical protein